VGGRPHQFDRVWATFPSGLYVPKAGCYYLDARWRSGQWRMTFGAGTH
jgi:hypothetical protein